MSQSLIGEPSGASGGDRVSLLSVGISVVSGGFSYFSGDLGDVQGKVGAIQVHDGRRYVPRPWDPFESAGKCRRTICRNEACQDRLYGTGSRNDPPWRVATLSILPVV